MIRTYKAKLYPNRKQELALTEFLDQSRHVYNRALERRRDAWRDEKKSLSKFDQQKELTQWRAADERLAAVPAWYLRDGLRRVDLGFQAFFRRVKAGQKPGYPRFKGANRWNSVSNGNPQGTMIEDLFDRVHLSGIKTPVRCRGLQEFTGEVKIVRVVRRAGEWFVHMVVDDGREPPAKQSINTSVGVDLGLTSFIALSNGETVKAPRHFRRLESKLRAANKSVSRKKRGSANRRKAVVALQKVHARIADARSDFTHKLSKALVDRFDLICVEDLNIKGLMRGRLAKSISDAAWGIFLFRVSYKASSAGKTFWKGNCRGSSQICSRCGALVPKDLSVRIHRCDCGLTIDRDVNSGRVMEDRGRIALGVPPVWAGIQACGDHVRPLAATAGATVVEAGRPN